jgi:flagellar hook-associated protein 1 FlgK
MPGIGGALDIARWSMYASQLSLEVSSHNIANANTEGYSRQSLRVEANYPITMGPGQIGTGVKASEVLRAYDNFVNKQVAQKKSSYSFWSTQKTALNELETIFNESDENGLNALMGQFWNSWGDLADNADGVPERRSLLANTENLIAAIHSMDSSLRDYQMNINTRISGAVGEVNSILTQIADLNNGISTVEIKGSINANDLRDRRDLLLEQLSEHLDISYYEEEQSGQVMVYALGGTPLVLGKDAYSLSTARNATTGQTDIIWNGTSGRTLNITDKLKGGDLAGLVAVRDKSDEYLASMNTLIGELVWQVNSLHSEGTGLQSVTGMTGTVSGIQATDDLSSDFFFSDRYNAGGAFDIVAYDSSGNVVNTYTINPAGSTVGDLITEINTEAAAGGNEITASLTADGRFQIQANGTYTFVVKPNATADSSNALAILGTNTYFTWSEQVGQPVNDITQTVDINSIVSDNPELISSGYLDSNNQVAPGENGVANAIAALQDKVITNMGGSNVDTTMDAYYSSLVAQVGVDVQAAEQNEKFYDTLLTQYTQTKESVSGVNLDEEMTNILKYQRLYQASAKLISICDEMMQSLLSIK